MRATIDYLLNPAVSLLCVQVVGLLIVLASRDSDEEILKRSGTYWDSNPHMQRYLVAKNYDLLVGILSLSLPTIISPILVEINLISPSWFNYTCLFCALALRLSSLRAWQIKQRGERLETKAPIFRSLQNIEQLHIVSKKTKNLSSYNVMMGLGRLVGRLIKAES